MEKNHQSSEVKTGEAENPVETAPFVNGTNEIPDTAFSLGFYSDEHSPTETSELFVGFHGEHYKVVRDPVRHEIPESRTYADQYPGMI